jgi:O-antigen/teichoic acid export membrane protein
MSNIRHKTTATYTIAASTLSILLMAFLASISSTTIPSFSQEDNNDDDDSALILSGRIR